MSGDDREAALQPLDPGRLEAGLGARSRRALAGLEVLERVDSTNARLLRRSDIAPRRFIACLAEEQTAGRGRRGRAWVSPRGNSIYMSLARCLAPAEPMAGALSLMLGIGVVEALSRFGARGIGLKWPNDLVVGGRKLGGILVETRRAPGGRGVLVAGLGVNLRWRKAAGDGIDQPWSDLATVMPAGLPERNTLAAALIDAMWQVLERPRSGLDAGVYARYAALDALSGRNVVVDTPMGRFSGPAQGIGPDGALRVRVGGRVREFLAAEVSVRALA